MSDDLTMKQKTKQNKTKTNKTNKQKKKQQKKLPSPDFKIIINKIHSHKLCHTKVL